MFHLKYESGEIKAVSYSADGSKIGECSLKTGNGATQLALCPEKKAVPEGDLAYVRIKYCTKDGTLNPLARGKIHAEIDGGKLLALGNACPFNADGYLVNDTDTYFGEALAIVKMEKGDMTITVSDGKTDCSCTIENEGVNKNVGNEIFSVPAETSKAV